MKCKLRITVEHEFEDEDARFLFMVAMANARPQYFQLSPFNTTVAVEKIKTLDDGVVLRIEQDPDLVARGMELQSIGPLGRDSIRAIEILPVPPGE